MAKKVSEIIKELGITFDELQRTASRLDIEVKSNRSSLSDVDANRVIDTISKLKGLNTPAQTESSKPKLKAVPIIGKGLPGKPKPPAGKPVPPKKAVSAEPAKEPEAAEKKPAAEPAKASPEEKPAKAPAGKPVARPVVKQEKKAEPAAPVKEQPEPAAKVSDAPEIAAKAEVKAPVEPKPEKPAPAEAAKKAEKKAETAPEEVKAEPATPVKKADEAEAPKADAEKQPAEEPQETPSGKDKAAEEEYVNSPDKPMRFKKIYDASKAPKPEQKPKKDKAQGKDKDRDNKDRDNKDRDGRDRGKGKESREGKDSRDSRDKERPPRGDKGDKKDRKGQDDSKARKQDKPESRRPKPAASDAPDTSASTKSASKGKSKKFFDNKDNKDRDRSDGRKRLEKRETGGAKNTHVYDEHSLEKQTRHKKKAKAKTVDNDFDFEELLPAGTVAVTAPITVAGLSEQADISSSKIIMSLMKLGVMATINQSLDKDTIELLADDLGLQIMVMEEQEEIEEPGLDLHEDAESELKPRAPIITVMGHVDHGKTSLLDAIRNTNVTAGESGGITQHIGASEVMINGKKIVFLDTPGHEAFTTMRARGAQVTDIAVLVVAADDGVMPQTVESISHAKAAGVPIIIAINKMDKPGANPDRVKQELTEHGILVEDWGGNVISVPVSAKKGEGITDLLEMILLQAEMLELKANPDRLALGNVIEARLDKAKGPIATLLVTNGTLKTGQSIVAGTCAGKIRVMTNSKGETIRKALPATPVEVLGLSDVPMAGDSFYAVKDDRLAREIAEQRKERMREEVMAKTSSMSLDKLFAQIQEGEVKELNIIVKADVQGSVGAIVQSLEKLETDEVKVNVVHSGVGTVTESDIMLAETSNAIIIGFNVRPTSAVMSKAADSEVEIRLYRVIYDIIDDIKDAMKGMLDPEFKEEVLGLAEVRDTFKVPSVGTIAGAYVKEGKVQRNAQIRLVRDGIVIHEGTISSLRRFKDDVREVNTGYECGIGIEKYNDIKPGDEIECFKMVEIAR